MAWWWEYNGFVFSDTTGSCVRNVKGFDMPDVRSNDVPNAAQHGVFPGFDRLDARVIGLSVDVKTEEGSPFFTHMRAQAAACGPSDLELPLRFQLGDDEPVLRANCRPRKRAVDVDKGTNFGVAKVELQFGAPFSDTYTWNFGVPGTGGVISVYNQGNAPAPWRATINGPCVNPTIIGPDGQLTWENTLQAGEFIELDAHPTQQTVMVGGTSSQFSQLTDDSTWFLLPSGTSNIGLVTGDGNGSISFYWRSAWWSVL